MPIRNYLSMPSVLIVDDSDLGRVVLGGMFSGSNFKTIFFAVNGQDAFDKAITHKPDLIILDVMMPYYDGIEVTRMIREHNDICNTPILIATALDDRETHSRAIKAGANDVVVKPFNKVKFLSLVNSLVAGVSDK